MRPSNYPLLQSYDSHFRHAHYIHALATPTSFTLYPIIALLLKLTAYSHTHSSVVMELEYPVEIERQNITLPLPPHYTHYLTIITSPLHTLSYLHYLPRNPITIPPLLYYLLHQLVITISANNPSTTSPIPHHDTLQPHYHNTYHQHS